MKYELNLREVTSALSTSLDYVGIDMRDNGKIDGKILSVLEQNLSESYRKALQTEI